MKKRRRKKKEEERWDEKKKKAKVLDSLDLCSLTRTTLSLFSLSLSPRLPKNGKIRNGFRDRLQERSSTKAKREREREKKSLSPRSL